MLALSPHTCGFCLLINPLFTIIEFCLSIKKLGHCLLEPVAGAHGGSPLWVVQDTTMVETVHMALESNNIIVLQFHIYAISSTQPMDTIILPLDISVHVDLPCTQAYMKSGKGRGHT